MNTVCAAAERVMPPAAEKVLFGTKFHDTEVAA